MYPKLFELGAINIYTYGVLLAAAYLTGLQVALVRARRRGLDPNRVMDLGIYMIISALIGAKLMLLIVEFEHFSLSLTDLWALVRSGGVFYGGLFLAVPVALWYMRRHRMPTWTTCDIFTPGIALGHAVGRIGCLMAGCCFGRPTSVPWGITFTSPLAASNVGTPLGVTLHPPSCTSRVSSCSSSRFSFSRNGEADRFTAARSGVTRCSTASRASSLSCIAVTSEARCSTCCQRLNFFPSSSCRSAS